MVTTTAAPAADVAVDTPVRYHGSITGHHGPARVLGPCDCEACWDEADYARLVGDPAPATRWELAPLVGSGTLLHVRRESFTVAGA